MYIIAFDCSAKSMSVALISGEEILAETNYFNEVRHSERLVLEIKNLLLKFNLDFFQIDLYVATNGPSSYTGIRVGLSVLKMLKITTKKPCITVNSCDVLAYKYRDFSSKINVLIESNLNEVYFAKYEVIKGELSNIVNPTIATLIEVENLICKDEFLCGSAWQNFQNHNLKSHQSDAILAKDVAILGKKMFLEKSFQDEIMPIYLRDPKISKRK